MPELPEAERARQILESVVGHRITAVDDSDTYVCRPHQPGEIASALVGHEFVTAHRRGKFLWLETNAGPTLGLHLGMAGRIALEAPHEKPLWDRFTVEFANGRRFALRDSRRLGRAVLNPDHAHVGPDAAHVGQDDFRRRVGVGNLLADEALWHAGIAPARRTAELSVEDLDRLRTELHAAVDFAIRHGGVHTGTFAQARGHEGACPACGARLDRAKVGGRTTYWCPECQV